MNNNNNNNNNIRVPSCDELAQWLEQTARLAVPVIALAVVLIELAARLAFDLGRLTGAAIHARNDELAALWRRLWAPSEAPSVPSATTPADAGEALRPWPAEPRLCGCNEPQQRAAARLQAPIPTHPLVTVAERLERLTAAELRQMVGTRSRRHRKADLIALAVAMV